MNAVPKPSEIRRPSETRKAVVEQAKKDYDEKKKPFKRKPHLTQRLGNNADLQQFRSKLK